ncbi:MAG TPA: hypothetical protein VNK04_14165 [Gemmataceae bacterium]|nr:hypothetical protein [Gemmataceae bacterium]
MSLRAPGAILLISCYELGHQPPCTALPFGFLRRAGFAPDALDIAVERFDPAKVARARFVGISVPMHTALRLGVRVAQRVREINPDAVICFYGLYAALNADYLLNHGGDYCIGGEVETPLVALVEALAPSPPPLSPEAGARGEENTPLSPEGGPADGVRTPGGAPQGEPHEGHAAEFAGGGRRRRLAAVVMNSHLRFGPARGSRERRRWPTSPSTCRG